MPEYCRFARPRRQTRYIRSLINTKGSRQHVHQDNQNPQHRRRQTRPPARAFSAHRRQGQAAHAASVPTIRWRARTGRRLPPKRWPPAAVRSRVQAAGHRQQGPGGSAPTLWRETHANCDRQPRQPREPALGRLPVPRGAISASRPRHHECADRRQDDPPASADCAMTARSFWSASRARRCTASATCVTGPPGTVQPRARAASPTPSPFTTSPMFTAAPTASSPASGARSAMIAPRWRGAGFRRSCEVLRGNVTGHGCAAEAGGGRRSRRQSWTPAPRRTSRGEHG